MRGCFCSSTFLHQHCGEDAPRLQGNLGTTAPNSTLPNYCCWNVMDLPERWASPECQHSHQLRELRFFLGSSKRGLQGGKVTGHQEGLVQDRDWRLKIGFPRAFPGEFFGTDSGSQFGMLVERSSSGIYTYPLSIPHSIPIPSIQPIWVQPLHKSHRERPADSQEFLWERKTSHGHRLHRLLFSLPASPWSWFVETRGSQEALGMQTLWSQIPQKRRGRELQTVPSHAPETPG